MLVLCCVIQECDPTGFHPKQRHFFLKTLAPCCPLQLPQEHLGDVYEVLVMSRPSLPDSLRVHCIVLVSQEGRGDISF